MYQGRAPPKYSVIKAIRLDEVVKSINEKFEPCDKPAVGEFNAKLKLNAAALRKLEFLGTESRTPIIEKSQAKMKTATISTQSRKPIFEKSW